MSLSHRILTAAAVLAWSVALSASPAATRDVDRSAPVVDIDPLPARLFITVRDDQGRAVHGAVVLLSGHNLMPQPAERTDIAGLASFSLAPGTYSVVAYYGHAAIRPEVLELAPGSETWAEVWLPLNLADFNGDGAVTSNDFFEFLQYWGDSLWEADFNRDGRVDALDFYEYMKAFLTDCTGGDDEEAPAIE